jgi:superfamily II DNA or RNA helicase
MSTQLTETMIRRQVGGSTYERGGKYQRQRRVIEWEREGSSLIHAKVQGSERRPYTQKIEIGSTQIFGKCSCHVGYNCKHVAAVLIDVLRTDEFGSNLALTTIPVPRFKPPPSPALPYEITSWLNRLKEAQSKAEAVARQAAPLSGSKAFLVYIISPLLLYQTQKVLAVNPGFVQFRKNGSISAGIKKINVDMMFSEGLAASLSVEDITICKLIKLCKLENYSPVTRMGYALTGSMVEDTLSAILATKRARLERADGKPITAGVERRASFEWRENDDGDFKLAVAMPDGGEFISSNPSLYLNRSTGEIGKINFGLSPSEVSAILQAPILRSKDVDHFRATITGPDNRFSALVPPTPRPVERVTGKPVPHIEFLGVTIATPPNQYWHDPRRQKTDAPTTIGIARISFEYPNGIRVKSNEGRNPLRLRQDDRIIELSRDTKAENRWHRQIANGDLTLLELSRDRPPKGHDCDFEPVDGQDTWPGFMQHELATLRQTGWQITVAPSFPFRIVEADGDMALTISDAMQNKSGIDWFKLDCGVVIEGVAVDLTEAIAGLITGSAANPALLPKLHDAAFLLPLSDGRYLSCPPDRIRAMIAGLVRLFEGRVQAEEGNFRFRTDRSADLAALETETAKFGVTMRGGERLRELGAKLQQATAASGLLPQIPVLENFRAELRSYQQTGLNWLSFLKETGFGCILADDMGLGKTIQALALLASEKSRGRLQGPALVIAPTSVVGNWQREAERFTPDMKTLVLHGLQRSSQFSSIKDHDLVITSYPLLARDHETLGAQEWSVIVMDEAQYLKNPAAETTRHAAKLKAQWRVALSGTPVQNNLMELWSLFNLITPGFLGDQKSFQTYYRNPIEKKSDKSRSELLARRVKPFILRRTKSEVARDLPAKTEITDSLELGAKQRDIYETIRLAMQKKVRQALAAQGLAKSHIIILDALLKLRQAALDPRLIADKAASMSRVDAGSAKLTRLMELLATLAEENRRVIVFSQFTSMLDLIGEQVLAADIPFLRLDGKTRERTKVTSEFQEERTPVFLVSLKAGGVGLNLTAADTVILFDPWWNPAVEDQAIDRVHRIGQNKPVFVHRLIAAGTIEEKMDTLKQKKRRIAGSIFDADGQITGTLTEQDIEVLLS